MSSPPRPSGSRAVVITDPALLVRHANQRIVLLRDRKQVAAIPVADISHLAAHGPITFTGAALASLLDVGVDISLHSSSGRYRGSIHGTRSKNVYLLLAQVDAWRRDERRLEFARALVASKLRGQRQLLQRRSLDRGSAGCSAAVVRIDQLLRAIPGAEPLDALLGYEGAASAAYFGAFSEMLGSQYHFPGRVRRPPTDPVNALLSFGYTLASAELIRALNAAGFDSRIGLFHGLRYGRESLALALDLVEDFRAPMVDRFTLALLNRVQLPPSAFETSDDGATRLKPDARRQYLELWEELLSARAPALNGETPASDETAVPARRLTRDPERDADPPITWRRRMEIQVDRLRRFLMNGSPYRGLFADKPSRKAKKTRQEGPHGSPDQG